MLANLKTIETKLGWIDLKRASQGFLSRVLVFKASLPSLIP